MERSARPSNHIPQPQPQQAQGTKQTCSSFIEYLYYFHLVPPFSTQPYSLIKPQCSGLEWPGSYVQLGDAHARQQRAHTQVFVTVAVRSATFDPRARRDFNLPPCGRLNTLWLNNNKFENIRDLVAVIAGYDPTSYILNYTSHFTHHTSHDT